MLRAALAGRRGRRRRRTAAEEVDTGTVGRRRTVRGDGPAGASPIIPDDSARPGGRAGSDHRGGERGRSRR